MKTLRLPVLRSLPVILLAILIAACSRARAEGGGAARPYRVGAADRGEVRVAVEETGVVEPERQIIVKSPISGVVSALSADRRPFRQELRDSDQPARGGHGDRLRPGGGAAFGWYPARRASRLDPIQAMSGL